MNIGCIYGFILQPVPIDSEMFQWAACVYCIRASVYHPVVPPRGKHYLRVRLHPRCVLSLAFVSSQARVLHGISDL